MSHHVALSVVGTDRLPDSGYMRAMVQEELIQHDVIPNLEVQGVLRTIIAVRR